VYPFSAVIDFMDGKYYAMRDMAFTTSSRRASTELTMLMVELARTELAAVSAMVKFWRGWVESADKFTAALSTELTRVAEHGEASPQFAGRLTDSTREYLRNVAGLPNLAINQFTNELEKIGKPSRRAVANRSAPRRRRAAKAKA
jgi:hypothetical protein